MRSPWISLLLGAALALPIAACQREADHASERSQEALMPIQLSSPAFAAGQNIPARHTCDAENLSPALEWSNVPAGTKSLALICDDPDAPVGTWVHWVLYGLPPTVTGLPEGVASTPTTSDSARQGTNDFKRVGYGGPCPPPGKPHRYFFKLYALDITLDLPAGASKQDLLHLMDGHVLGRGELVGLYARK